MPLRAFIAIALLSLLVACGTSDGGTITPRLNGRVTTLGGVTSVR